MGLEEHVESTADGIGEEIDTSLPASRVSSWSLASEKVEKVLPFAVEDGDSCAQVVKPSCPRTEPETFGGFQEVGVLGINDSGWLGTQKRSPRQSPSRPYTSCQPKAASGLAFW